MKLPACSRSRVQRRVGRGKGKLGTILKGLGLERLYTGQLLRRTNRFLERKDGAIPGGTVGHGYGWWNHLSAGPSSGHSMGQIGEGESSWVDRE